MFKLYFIFLHLLAYNFSYSQNINGPRIAAIGNAAVAVNDIWSINSNSSGLSNINRPTLAIAYENKFNISELNSKSAVLALPFKSYVIGTSVQSYGNEYYNEIKGTVTLVKSFDKKLALAISLNMHQIGIEQYGNRTGFSVEAGFQYSILKNLLLAGVITNPNESKYNSVKDQAIPTKIAFGSRYLFSNKVFISSELEKILDSRMDFKSGIEYKMTDLLAFRTGMSVNPIKQYGGFGIHYQQLLFDFAVSSHPILGYSSQFGLAYEF
jgi:hypothetical protein